MHSAAPCTPECTITPAMPQVLQVQLQEDTAQLALCCMLMQPA